MPMGRWSILLIQGGENNDTIESKMKKQQQQQQQEKQMKTKIRLIICRVFADSGLHRSDPSKPKPETFIRR